MAVRVEVGFHHYPPAERAFDGKTAAVDFGPDPMTARYLSFARASGNIRGDVLQEMSVQARIVVPFTPLAKFTAHEQYLLARMGIQGIGI